MSDETGHLVRYEMTTLERAQGPYPAGAEWAEPDLGHAAELMRRVFDDRTAAAELGARGRASIIANHGTEPTALFLRQRLDAIRGTAGRAAPAEKPTHTPAAARAQAWLASGLDESWAHDSRYGAAGARARSAMLRAIQPYTRRQAELDGLLTEAAVESQAGQDDLRRRVLELEEQVLKLQRAASASARAQGEMDERANSQRRSIDAVRDDLTRLDQRLHAPPALSDPALLTIRDAEGREAIGFEGGSSDDPDAVYLGFENVFRSDEEGVTALQRFYLDMLCEHGPVLDVGSGRGELLDLLAAAGVAARGVDSDQGMVDLARAKGHDVTCDDAVSHLRSLPAACLGAVFCAQLVEHLTYPDLKSFLVESARVLRPGGVLVAETVNPEPVQSFKAYWIDPTHETLLYPDVLLTLCRLAGFDRGRVLFPGGTGIAAQDRRTQPAYAVVVRTAVR